jgi:hypothetical protein
MQGDERRVSETGVPLERLKEIGCGCAARPRSSTSIRTIKRFPR